jgi:hypothetical protein
MRNIGLREQGSNLQMCRNVGAEPLFKHALVIAF